MILSRTLAKARIARGARTGWLAAWVPVLIDAALFAGFVILSWGTLMQWIDTLQPSNLATFALFFVLYFVPMQAVLILSSLWAAKSRWQETEPQ